MIRASGVHGEWAFAKLPYKINIVKDVVEDSMHLLKNVFKMLKGLVLGQRKLHRKNDEMHKMYERLQSNPVALCKANKMHQSLQAPLKWISSSKRPFPVPKEKLRQEEQEWHVGGHNFDAYDVQVTVPIVYMCYVNKNIRLS